MSVARLTVDEIESRLQELPGWQRVGDELDRTYRFGDFRSAMAFLNAIAKVAEAQDHHPDWRNCYSRVSIRLSTHEAGGITDRDFQLAKAMVAAAVDLGGK